MKKTLSVLLSIIMIFSINTIVASAETEYLISDFISEDADWYKYVAEENGWVCLESENSLVICFYAGNETSITVPTKIMDIEIGWFGGFSASARTTVEQVVVPEGVGLWSEVFKNCVNLSNVVLPPDTRSIPYQAFSGCSSLKNITIPESVEVICEESFSESGLESIVIPKSVTRFGDFAFFGCKSLKQITIKSDVMNRIRLYSTSDDANTVPTGFLGSCTSLETVELPHSIKEIDAHTFSYCTNLRTVDLPKSLETIHNGVFQNCTSLKNIYLPETLKSIHTRAFMSSALENITMPKSCTNLGEEVFQECKNLKQIVFKGETVNTLEEYIDEDDKEIISEIKNAIPGYFAYGCDSLASVTIPKNVKTIYKYAFYGCENLTSVKFAGAVNNIGKSAFSKCVNLKTVNFTKGYLKKVYDYAFYKCEKLDKITISNTKNVPTIAKSAFNKAKSGIKFYVKNNTVAKKLKAKLQKTNIKKAKIYRSAPILIYKNIG